jgi:hypothetical protein
MFLTLSLWRFLGSFDDAHRTYFKALLLPELIQTGYAEATATGRAAEVQWDSEDLTTYSTAGEHVFLESFSLHSTSELELNVQLFTACMCL